MAERCLSFCPLPLKAKSPFNHGSIISPCDENGLSHIQTHLSWGLVFVVLRLLISCYENDMNFGDNPVSKWIEAGGVSLERIQRMA